MTQKNLYTEEFEKLVREWMKQYPDKNDLRSYIGVGNPNTKILLVGREGVTQGPIQEIKNKEISFADQWLEKIEKNKPVEPGKLRPLYPAKEIADNKYRPLNGQTWVKYQKLYDLITKKKCVYGLGSQLDFLEHVFTTEMNPNRAPQTNIAETGGIKERKEHFFTSDFIRNFPIVILACGFDYIKNAPGNWEINKIFGVEYVSTPKDGNDEHNGLPFWAHYDNIDEKNRTRLVINTRQLSGRINGSLLSGMADVIRDFAARMGLEL